MVEFYPSVAVPSRETTDIFPHLTTHYDDPQFLACILQLLACIPQLRACVKEIINRCSALLVTDLKHPGPAGSVPPQQARQSQSVAGEPDIRFRQVLQYGIRNTKLSWIL